MVTSNEHVRNAHHRLRYATEGLGVNTEPPPVRRSTEELEVNAEVLLRRPSAPAENHIAWQRPLQVQPPGQPSNKGFVPEHGLCSPSEVNNNGISSQARETENSLFQQQRFHQRPLTPPFHNGAQPLQPQVNGRRQSFPYYQPNHLQQGTVNQTINGLPESPPEFLPITHAYLKAVEKIGLPNFALLGNTDVSTSEKGLCPPQHQSQQLANHLASNCVPTLQARFPPIYPTAPRTLSRSVRPVPRYNSTPRAAGSRQPLRSSPVASIFSRVESRPKPTQGPAVQQWDLRSLVRSNQLKSQMSHQNPHGEKRGLREELRRNTIPSDRIDHDSAGIAQKGVRRNSTLPEALSSKVTPTTQTSAVQGELVESSQQLAALTARVGTPQPNQHPAQASSAQALQEPQLQAALPSSMDRRVEELFLKNLKDHRIRNGQRELSEAEMRSMFSNRVHQWKQLLRTGQQQTGQLKGEVRRKTIAAGVTETQTMAAQPKRPAASFTQDAEPSKRRKVATNKITEHEPLNTKSNSPYTQTLPLKSTLSPDDLNQSNRRRLYDFVSTAPQHYNKDSPSDELLMTRAPKKRATSKTAPLNAFVVGQDDTAENLIINVAPSYDEFPQAITVKYEDWKWSVYHYEVTSAAGYAHAERWVEALFESNLAAEFNARHSTHVSQGFIQDGDRRSILVLHNAANPFEYEPAPESTTTIGVYGYHWYEHSEIHWTTLASDQRALLVQCVDAGLLAVKHKWTFDSPKATEKRFHRAYWLAANRLMLGGLLNRGKSDDKPHDLIEDKSEEDRGKDWSVHKEDLTNEWDVTDDQAVEAWQKVQDEVEALGDEFSARENGWPHLVTRHKEY